MPVDIRPDHMRTVLEVLNRLIPDREVWAFGSRATWTARDTSDLDLAVIGNAPLDFRTLAALRDAFSESNIPYKVDVVDWATISETFREIIRKDKVVIQKSIKNHWVSKKIGELGKVVTGKTPTTTDPENFGGPYPFITIPDLDGRHFIDCAQRTLSEKGAKALKNNVLPPYSVMLSCIATVGKTGITTRKSFTNQQINSVIPNENIVDSLFLYYLFTQLGHKLESRGGGGSVYANVSKSLFSNIEVNLPSNLSEQRAIAHILGTLDDKIDLNRRMNETLEAMAQALFKSWFVDFDPVRAKMEGRPTGLPKEIEDFFPDSFEDSELGEIPRGWEVTVLGEIINILDSKRIPLSGKQRNERPGPYPYYGAAGILDFIDDFIFEGIFILVGEDGSVINRNGNPVTQYVWGKFWVSNHAHVLSGNRGISNEHLLLFLQTLEIGPYVTGAVQPKLNQTNLCRIPFLLPNESICKSFEDIVSPIYAIYRENFMQIKILTNIRDNLLPKLLSGEIKVSGIPPRQRSTGERQAK